MGCVHSRHSYANKSCHLQIVTGKFPSRCDGKAFGNALAVSENAMVGNDFYIVPKNTNGKKSVEKSVFDIYSFFF